MLLIECLSKAFVQSSNQQRQLFHYESAVHDAPFEVVNNVTPLIGAEQVFPAMLEAIGLRVEKFDYLVAQARQAVDLLRERRSALISAAVTGQIDVRGLVELDAVDGHVIGDYTEPNPEDWSQFGLDATGVARALEGFGGRQRWG